MGRQDSFIDCEKCHSPTPVREWQQTDLQPAHRPHGRPSAWATKRSVLPGYVPWQSGPGGGCERPRKESKTTPNPTSTPTFLISHNPDISKKPRHTQERLTLCPMNVVCALSGV